MIPRVANAIMNANYCNWCNGTALVYMAGTDSIELACYEHIHLCMPDPEHIYNGLQLYMSREDLREIQLTLERLAIIVRKRIDEYANGHIKKVEYLQNAVGFEYRAGRVQDWLEKSDVVRSAAMGDDS